MHAILSRTFCGRPMMTQLARMHLFALLLRKRLTSHFIYQHAKKNGHGYSSGGRKK